MCVPKALEHRVRTKESLSISTHKRITFGCLLFGKRIEEYGLVDAGCAFAPNAGILSNLLAQQYHK